MRKKVFPVLLLILISFCLSIGSVIASETSGTIDVGVQSGMEGVIRAAPTASPIAGTYHVTKSVALTASGSTAICYTTDSSTPSCSGAYACTNGTLLPTGSTISVTLTTTIKSIACYADESYGDVSSDIYTLTCSTASVANGTVSAYPGCAITCNSGYTLSGSTCVSSGGGGGGGGGTSASMPITTSGIVTATKNAGGKTTFTDPAGNDVQVKVSSNTVGDDTDFTVGAVAKSSSTVSGLLAGLGTSDGSLVGNYFYNFTAVDEDGNEVTEFDKSVKITIYYDEDALGTIDEEDLVIFYWDEDDEEWKALTGSKVYASSNKVVVYVDHFTYFALFGAEGVATEDGGLTAEELAAKIEQLLTLLTALRQELAGLSGVSDIADIPVSFTFTGNLKQGMSSTEIKYLQVVLNSDSDTRIAASGVGSPGRETNYFGSLTKAAVIKFQEKYYDDILAPWGFQGGTGYVARTTRAKLNEILGK